MAFSVFAQRKCKQGLERYLFTNVQSSITHNNPKVGATQMPIDGGMGKQNWVYTFNGILFYLKNKGNFDTCYHMGDP